MPVIKLLVYRVIPLGLRPLAILLEGMLSGKPALLVLSLPIAMMALMLSSIPVHLEYFKARSGEPSASRLAIQYKSGLGWIFCFSLLVLWGVLYLPFFGLESVFIAIVCLTFIVEKFSDESSRSLEFKKNYFGWFLVQVLRSGWVFVPLLVAFLGGGYEDTYLTISFMAAFFSLVVFVWVTGLSPSLNLPGLISIKDNMVYFFGSFLPASYRQLPRIVIAKAYPEQAHAFLALSQLAQGVGILFNVRFQIPYRKIIARKPLIFQRLMEPVMKRILFGAFFIAGVYMCVPMFLDLSDMKTYLQMLFFSPVVFADALVFSVLSAHLGYIQWLSQPSRAIQFYLLGACLAAFVALVLFFCGYLKVVNLVGIPIAVMAVGLVWLLMAKEMFFINAKPKV